MQTPRPWTVLPHGPLEVLEHNLRVVEGTLPRGHVPRRMTVARLGDGRLVFHNAIPLEEPSMKALEAWGRPAVLFVPNGWHRLDIHAYKVRYPDLEVLCPAPVRERVAQAVPVDGTVEDFPADPDVRLIPLRGTKIGEVALAVRHGDRTSLCFGDVVMNLVKVGGLDGLLFRLLGSVGGPRVTFIARLAVMKDRGQLKGHLEELAALPGLARLIPSHGEVVDRNAAEALRQVAARLG